MAIADLLQLDPLEIVDELLEAHRDEPGWLDELAEALDRRRAGPVLGRILRVWGLSQSEAAELFGVTRQAVGKWLATGVPAARVQATADLAATTDLLIRHVKRDRIPAVVRRHAAALGGKSLVDLVAVSRTRKVLEACRSMFDFQRAHE